MKNITEEQLKEIRNTLALMNSMIRGGEQHSEQSTDRLRDTLTLVNNLPIYDVVERVSLMKDNHSGREECSYGDTDYDSMTVVYGYNLAIDNVTDMLNKL